MRAKALARLAVGLTLVSLSSGCFLVVPVPLGTAVVPPATAPSGPDSCGAAGLKDLIGQPKSALDGRDLAAGTRVLHPGQPVTMEYSATRLNILIDRKGRISSLNCG
ncbi:I78 family peptidase inhibitor [Rhodobacter capsulatus]|uniref:I78 family peptidase inhibitor n=1 Tax=Rhodobacter capsulatus TaxID=1061 RepID=UPI0003D3AF78|nr:I78 family peptidase inhibitor [Rhodobacter capsulatus]ETD86287.1 hypothetical protein U716_03410 [Rhodobacter capsulatus B6]